MQDVTPQDAIPTVIDRFLAEQASLSAAERFGQVHDAGIDHAGTYTDLMPASPPGPGQQYAFDVDLDACTGCKACVTACRSLNGLDDEEQWRSVGLLLADTGPQHVTMACHHCVDPGCLNGCPVDAYTKDPVTGIVRHLDDQCIGCSYCTLTCPYEVPRYSRERGIVRKCDLCADRLAEGEAPACVQGCPTNAISIRVIDVAETVDAAARPWPLHAPDPARTIPTTSYRSRRALATAPAADAHQVRVNDAHPPLAVMLVLTQLAVGLFSGDLLLRLGGTAGALTSGYVGGLNPGSPGGPAGAVTAVIVAVLALGASTLHLGRPRYAYRAVIGLRHSWLSREIVAFGLFTVLAGLSALAPALGASPLLLTAFGVTGAAAGIVGIACSAQLYAVTGRRWWRVRTLGPRFALTAAGGGSAALLGLTAVGAAVSGTDGEGVRVLAAALVGVTVVKIGSEALVLRHLRGPDDELARTGRLLMGPLAAHTRWRLACGLLGGIGAPLLLLGAVATPARDVPATALVAFLAVGGTVGGDLLERWLMFTASSPRRMPGGVR